jgi:hypothetical protein
MAKSTTPMLLVTGMTYGNAVLLNGKSPSSELKILLAGGIATLVLAGIEEIPDLAPLAVGIAWIAFITAFVAPVNGGPSVAQNLINYTGIGKT